MDLLTNPAFMAVAIIGVCLLGISKGGFLGLGVMALPLMSLFVPPLQAAAIILPTAIAQDFLTLWIYRREWSAWNIKIMLPSMMFGMFCAWLMAAYLTAAHIRLAIGLIATLFVLRHWTAKHLANWTPKPSVATGIVFGAIGGVTTMLANAGGPAWQIHLLPQKLEKLPYIGTVSILFAASNLVKMPGFATLGYRHRREHAGGLRAGADRGRRELSRHLVGAEGVHRDVLQDRLCADVRDRGRTDAKLDRRAVVGLGARPACMTPCRKTGGAHAASPL